MTAPTAWTTGRRPGLPGRALMLYAADIDRDDVPRFEAWYTHEHLPERVAVPGFLRGRRYVRAAGPGREHLTVYDAVDPAVFASPEYLARLDDPTPVTREVVAAFRRPHRVVLEVLFSHGAATGRELAVLRFPDAEAVRLQGWVAAELAPASLADPDLCGLHLAVADLRATGAKSGTAEARGTAEEGSAGCVLLVDGLRRVAGHAERAAELCRQHGFAAAGGGPTVYEHLVTLLPG